jgi:hypothetical protein
MTDNKLTCAECDELLPEYFEGRLSALHHNLVDAHAAGCVRCQGLIRDIEAIRVEAAALPELAPSRDLWKGIEGRIQPAVVSIDRRRGSPGWSSRVVGLAAAALVVVSSSVTYLVTAGIGRGGERPARIAEQPGNTPVKASTGEIGSPAGSATLDPLSPGMQAKAPDARAARQPEVMRNGGTPTTRASLASTTSAAASPAELILAPEITNLQQLLNERRQQLDPSTVKVVEDNLKIIDAAIEQAKAALARDPASGFLTSQVDDALQKKVQLLRTVALLPSRS